MTLLVLAPRTTLLLAFLLASFLARIVPRTTQNGIQAAFLIPSAVLPPQILGNSGVILVLRAPFGSNEAIRGGPLSSFRMKAGKPGRPGSIKSLGLEACLHAL